VARCTRCASTSTIGATLSATAATQSAIVDTAIVAPLRA